MDAGPQRLIRSTFRLGMYRAARSAIRALPLPAVDLAAKEEVERLTREQDEALADREDHLLARGRLFDRALAAESALAAAAEEVRVLREENERLSRRVLDGILPGLLEEDEQAALVSFVKSLRAEASLSQSQTEAG